MTPCGKVTDEDTRVRTNRSLVYFHNCTNAHDVNPFFLNDRCLKWGMNVTLLIGSTLVRAARRIHFERDLRS